MANIVKNQSSIFGNKNVVFSNVLTRSAQSLSLVEKRILMFALAEMAGVSRAVRLPVQEYAQTYGVDTRNAYSQLKTAAQNFRSRYITFAEEHRNGPRKTWEINWVSFIGYEENQGFLEIKFNSDLHPYLFDLVQQFTKYQLKQAAALRSIYSWRLLELLEQMRGKKDGVENHSGWLLISLSDFHDAMDATATHKRSFAETRRKIIEPAIKELTDKDGWIIDWQPIKKGKKVDQLRFDFRRNAQARLSD